MTTSPRKPDENALKEFSAKSAPVQERIRRQWGTSSRPPSQAVVTENFDSVDVQVIHSFLELPTKTMIVYHLGDKEIAIRAAQINDDFSSGHVVVPVNESDAYAEFGFAFPQPYSKLSFTVTTILIPDDRRGLWVKNERGETFIFPMEPAPSDRPEGRAYTIELPAGEKIVDVLFYFANVMVDNVVLTP